ncbi:UdgX family uracil-DNA binding protein [Brevundimonas variabilis]|uniref:Type-4 uracil-DNA glycosylase n=1 Tax=Brevundimonas variabilis TaxID=74312 RepID=A0A7W9CKS2_9CAUL|nr:UdgX family uracil-DNA binding protein [Brevundimonas variabilis]MBB5747510.1 DNA polymerase [Brevundimonas variabilis]
MRVATLAHEIDFDGWRVAARALRLEGVEPAQASFRVGGSAEQGGLFDQAETLAPGTRASPAGPIEQNFTVSKTFVDLAQQVILHRSADRFDLMYRLLWRLRDEPDLMKVTSDIDVVDALDRAKNVSRASHKMKAFVRFREIEDADGPNAIAWFEPAHRVLEKTAPFFVRRFQNMRWSILTPDGSCSWDLKTLTFGPPATADQAPQEDEVEEFWKTYYASTFNPARLKTKTMQGEMPKRYWKNLPEAALIPEMIAAAKGRSETMVATPASAPNPRTERIVAQFDRETGPQDRLPVDLNELAAGVQGCRRCPLWRDATQGVCGQGPRNARLMIVGEQPGDQEDLAGKPFVGPAGRVLDDALIEAGIERSDVYVTNAVKHFKHEPQGKRRLHKTPNAGEVTACRWWLTSERDLIRPRAVLMLGATASLAVLDRKVAVTRERGQALALDDGSAGLITVHPSYLLRLPDPVLRAQQREAFVADLRRVRTLL